MEMSRCMGGIMLKRGTVVSKWFYGPANKFWMLSGMPPTRSKKH